jgi:hypothetical protein
MKYIFVPINKDSIHWTLAVIYMEKKCIQYYDSLSGDKDAAKFGSKIMDGLLTYVADEYKKNNGGEEEMNVSEWELINCCSTASPQQSNRYDCGVFLCMTCKCILNDSALVFDQSHMNQCRDNILVSILKGIPTALALEQCTYEPNIADVGSPASCVVSSPQQPLHTKRKAKAENTPSGVDRQNQSQKCDMNLNAGNMAATTANAVTTSNISISGNNSLADPPALDRSTRIPRSSMSMTGSNSDSDMHNPNMGFAINDIRQGCVDDIEFTMGMGLDCNDFIAGLFASSDAHDNGDGDNLFNTLSHNVAMNCDQSINCYDYIPSEMKEKSFKPGYKLSKQYSRRCMAGERVGLLLPLNTMEDQLLFGCGGIMRAG